MDIHEIIKLYQEGKSLSFLANKYNTYGAKIKRILQENQINIRTRAEQNRITNQERGKKLNHEYFNVIDTNEKAWLLGFLAADGSVSSNRNRIKIGLSSVDREILEKIQNLIESERDIFDYETSKGFMVSELSWSSENHKKQLGKFGIVNNKTYKETHLPNLNLEQKLSFILGYYDGDGCFRNDGKHCRLEICSYRPELLEDFAEVLNKLCQADIKVKPSKSRKNYFTLTYSTNHAFVILNKLYLLNDVYLERKKEKFQNWIKNNGRI